HPLRFDQLGVRRSDHRRDPTILEARRHEPVRRLLEQIHLHDDLESPRIPSRVSHAARAPERRVILSRPREPSCQPKPTMDVSPMAGSAMLANLFRPLDVGPVELDCRIVSTAHQTTLAREHVVTPELLAYQEARARGGVGLIIMEAAATEPAGLLSDEMMAGYLPRTIDGYREVQRVTASYGTNVFVPLF